MRRVSWRKRIGIEPKNPHPLQPSLADPIQRSQRVKCDASRLARTLLDRGRDHKGDSREGHRAEIPGVLSDHDLRRYSIVAVVFIQRKHVSILSIDAIRRRDDHVR